MFAQRDIAQFGISARPVMPLSPGKLVLVSEDPRTDEEKERDLEREAQKLTTPMFDAPVPVKASTVPNEDTLALPVLLLSKNTLIAARPDLAEQIEQLDTAAMSALAHFIAQALRQSFQSAVDLALDWNLDARPHSPVLH
jgi:hypothetical protein